MAGGAGDGGGLGGVGRTPGENGGVNRQADAVRVELVRLVTGIGPVRDCSSSRLTAKTAGGMDSYSAES